MNFNPKKSNSIWLQITAGQGPKECGWVVGKVSELLLREACKENVTAEVIEWLAYDKLLRKQDLMKPEEFLSIVIRLEGDNAVSFAYSWAGTIRWQGQSPYRPEHKRINWFIGVHRVDVSESSAITLESLKKHVAFSACKSSGAGGQHVNKTDSAVRLTHKPSGIQLRVDADRSQHKNKAIALERLQILLEEKNSQSASSVVRERWLKHSQVGRGNPVRRFTDKDFNSKQT